MAYTKTTWNNLSNPPINADNLNKIEQGIYDNSLGIDIINPSGTATTTAEIEEGQINDVIGFKSLKLKGQTSQGENPTPDSPQDVNNVSGYNEINICGKNLFDKDNIISGYRLDGSGNPSSSANNEFTSDFIPVESGTTYIRSYGNISAYTRTCFYDKNKSFVSKNDDSQSFTIPINVKYIRFSEYLSKLDTMQLEQGSSATSYTAHQGNNFDIDLPIELCKIGTYADYIYKKDGKWWKHKAIKKIILNGTENWAVESNYSRFGVQNLVTDYLVSECGKALCTHYKYGDASNEGFFALSSANNYLFMHYPSAEIDTVAEFKEWLSSNNVSIYCVLTNSVEEEITYTPLIRQLDELYNSGLYDVTNISQDNSSEAFVLDIEACKNNINGIVEYIRR